MEATTYLLSKYEVDKGTFGSRYAGNVQDVPSGMPENDNIASEGYVPVVE